MLHQIAPVFFTTDIPATLAYYTKDGGDHTITPEKFEKLIADTDKLVLLVDAQDEKFSVKAQEASAEEESKGGKNDAVF